MASSCETSHRQPLRQAEALVGKHLQLAHGTPAKNEQSHRHCLGMWGQSSWFQDLNIWRWAGASQRWSESRGDWGRTRLMDLDHLGYGVQVHVQRLELQGKYCARVLWKGMFWDCWKLRKKCKQHLFHFILLKSLCLETTVLERKKVIRVYRSHPTTSANLTQREVARVRRRDVFLGDFHWLRCIFPSVLSEGFCNTIQA